jgi:hypothetical protein
MHFSEANQEWRTLPRWAEFLIRLGYDWPALESRPRRIALLSMPCDSAAAGLVTLGALIRDFGNPNANDAGTHFEALLRYARQYLEKCRDCKTRCHPELRECGYIAEASGYVRKDGKPYLIVKISDQSAWGQAIVCSNKNETRWLLGGYSTDTECSDTSNPV